MSFPKKSNPVDVLLDCLMYPEKRGLGISFFLVAYPTEPALLDVEQNPARDRFCHLGTEGWVSQLVFVLRPCDEARFH